MLVSIITPTWNRIEYEKRAIQSVLDQTHRDWELLISDASDGHELEDWLPQDARIVYERTVNRSPHTRRQELFAKAKGELCCFLDSDDYWEKTRLAEHEHVFKRYPWLGLSWDRFKDVGEDHKIRQPFPNGLVQPPRLGRHLLGHDNFVHMSSLTASRKAIVETGGFPDSWLGDWLMAIRIGLIYPCFYIQDYLSYRDLSAPSRISHIGDRDMVREYRRVQKYYLTHRPKTALLPLAKYFLSHGRKGKLFKPVLDHTPDLVWIAKNRILKLHQRWFWLKGWAETDGFQWRTRGVNDAHLSYSTHEDWLKPEILQEGELFVDIGAHVGRWSLRASRYYKHVESFEPTNQTRSVLIENLARNHASNVTVHAEALGEDFAEMNLRYFPRLRSNGGNSLLEKNPVQQEKYAVGARVIQRVSVRPLDSYRFRPSMVKIDTEGFEVPILNGMRATLKSTGRILVEIHRDSDAEVVEQILASSGFKTRRILQMFEQHVLGERG